MLFSRRQWLAALFAAAVVHALIGVAVIVLQPQPRSWGQTVRRVTVSLSALASPEQAGSGVSTPEPVRPAQSNTAGAVPVSSPQPEPAAAAGSAAVPAPVQPETPVAEPLSSHPEIPASGTITPDAAGTVGAPRVVEAVTVSAAAAASARPAPQANAADAAGAPTGAAATVDTYIGRVRRWLARHKSYPEAARRQGLEGVVRLLFAVDRQGHVLSYRIVSSSGHELLDREVRRMIERAQPLPSMPSSVNRTRIELIVPVRFTLH